LAPGKWIGFSRLLPSILLSVGVCGNANIASKGVPGTLKPFLRTLKSVFSTFWKDVVIVSSCEDLKTGNNIYLKYNNLEVEVIVKTRIGVFDARTRRSLRFTGWNTKTRLHVKEQSRGFVWLRHQATEMRATPFYLISESQYVRVCMI
jgi:hypothetical protein